MLGYVHFCPRILLFMVQSLQPSSLTATALYTTKPLHLSLSLHRLALALVHVPYIAFLSFLFPISFWFDYLWR